MSTDDKRTQQALNNANTFVWHELYTPDAAPAIDFYTKCLDFGTESMSMGEMGEYRMLTRNGQPVCGLFATGEHADMEDVHPHWAVYLSVDDVDARIAKCQEAGAKLVVPAMDVPTVGRMALIQDPAGAHIWLFKGEGM